MRLIDADALKEWVEEYHTSNWGIPQDELIYAIGSAQTIDPINHGKWIADKYTRKCSECESTYWMREGNAWNYCPNCGAKNGGEG